MNEINEIKKIDFNIKNLRNITLMLEILFIFILAGTTPILGVIHFSFSEFCVYSLIILGMYVPMAITNKFLFDRRFRLQSVIDQKERFEKQQKDRSERIFTEKDRTYDYQQSYNQRSYNQSQQKSEFYANKNMKNIIHEKELKILNLEVKELKFYTKSDIKNAYRKVAKENHPDFAKNEHDTKIRTEKMFAINAAYEVLLKKVK